ncbi:methyltransferase [Coniella lustricola]|uniref:Methyltransferase n=1 Tax=Coniella lustricola TaxID=2025994 RepID=A0A2T3AK99_9PEZI|nr:methyltransferase [Coniella lustricola]
MDHHTAPTVFGVGHIEPDISSDGSTMEDDRDFLFSDTDSALGSDMSLFSSTASLRSSILRSMEENGRRYHGYKEGKYVLPVDERELDRQIFQYDLCLLTFDNHLSFAPFRQLNRVLDVGCGVGYWALDFAEMHPEAQVVGVDLSPVQPAYVPPNVQFEIDDLEEPWNFSYPFDYIHVMMMTGAFRDWPNFYRQAFDGLTSGGWVEIQDIQFPLHCDDNTLAPNSALKKWSDLMVEAGDKSGFTLTTCERAGDMMHQAGFVDIVRIPYKWPINEWPREAKWKEVGRRTGINFRDGMEGIMMALFTRFMGWTKEQVEDFSQQVDREWQDTRIHAYFNLWVTYGRKA